MKCPVDNETLVMTERSGVEIDYCPVCRGVWLDRGELDKIIERSQPQMAQPVRPAPPVQGWTRHDDRRRPKKRESFLSELFDFD